MISDVLYQKWNVSGINMFNTFFYIHSQTPFMLQLRILNWGFSSFFFSFPTLCHHLLYSEHLWWCSISYCCLVTKMFPTLCDPMDCSLPGSSFHWIFEARIPEWIPIPFSSEYSLPRDRTQVQCIEDQLFTNWAYQGGCSISQNALLSTLRFVVSSWCLLWLAFSPYNVSERCLSIQFYIPP